MPCSVRRFIVTAFCPAPSAGSRPPAPPCGASMLVDQDDFAGFQVIHGPDDLETARTHPFGKNWITVLKLLHNEPHIVGFCVCSQISPVGFRLFNGGTDRVDNRRKMATRF